MKKAVDILCVVSVVSIVSLLLLTIILNGGNAKIAFVYEWLSSILVALSIPLIFRGFSLFAQKEKIKPGTWLVVYGCTISGYLLLASVFGFIDRTKDIFCLINNQYSVVEGTPSRISVDNSNQIIVIGNMDLQVERSKFAMVDTQKVYKITYLPNSQYVIDIVDETGNTLSKK